jgi:acyl carrier protein
MELETFLKNFADMLDETAPELIKADTNFRELEEWSSLTALSLIAMVDEEYSIKLTGEDIRSSITIAELFNKIANK